MRNKILWRGGLLLSAGVALGMSIGTLLPGDDAYKSLKKLEDAFLVITQRYVEDVDPGLLAETAIEGMLAELDPHSVYIDSEQMRIRVEQGKGRKDRYTILPQSTLELLRAYYRFEHPIHYLFNGRHRGERIHERSIQGLYELARKKAGITRGSI